MADMQKSMNNALDQLKKDARIEDANRIRGDVKIINKDQIRAIVEKFVKEFGTDVEMIEKIKTLGGQMDALKGDLDNAAAEKKSLEDRINILETEKLSLQARLDEADIENLNAMKRRLEDETGAREIAEEKVAKLEGIVACDDLQSKLKDVEYELIELKKAYAEAVLALEFIDFIEEVNFPELAVKAAGILEKLSAASVPEAAQPHVETVKSRVTCIAEQLKLDQASWEKLLGQIYDNKGTIPVVVEAVRLAVRCTGFKNELALASAASGLVGA